MSGVLHPVGPEPTQTYWLRRALVLGALLVVIAIIIALVVNRNPGATAVPAAPASTTSSFPLDSPAPSPTPGPSTPSASTPSALGSSKPSTSSSATAKPTTGKTAAPTKSARPTVVQPISCNPAELRPTLTGKKKLEPKEDNTFTLSLINGAKTTCVATVNATVFELKIYSGKDRIWSTDDCASLVKPFRAILASEKAIEWTMKWNGRRSAEDCKNRPEIPKTGTYFATAQLDGAKPVQLRMILRN
ncbi:MAG: hypothetical protein ABWY56_05985 [Propionibacteriaceae bacterium]